MIHVYMISSSW